MDNIIYGRAKSSSEFVLKALKIFEERKTTPVILIGIGKTKEDKFKLELAGASVELPHLLTVLEDTVADLKKVIQSQTKNN